MQKMEINDFIHKLQIIILAYYDNKNKTNCER